MSPNTLHSSFTLQGNAFENSEALVAFSKELDSEVHAFLCDWFSEVPYITVRTSGSTGTPKEIRLLKVHMIHSAKTTGLFFNLPEKTSALLCLSTTYIAGKMMWVRALTLGWDLEVIPPTSTPLQGLSKTYDFSAMVPLQLEASLEELSAIKTLIVGGGAVSNTTIERLREVSTKVYATYGMTETCTHIAVQQLSQQDNFSSKVYTTLPHVSISIDHRDCLLIDAPYIASEKIITNDVVRLISKNSFEWLGRIDHVINSGGIKIHPETLEKKLAPYINTRFFFMGIEDEVLGQKLVLFIESDTTVVTKESLEQLGVLERYEIPKNILTVSKFIETPTGKIQRKQTYAFYKLSK